MKCALAVAIAMAIGGSLSAQELRGEDEPGRYSFSQAATFRNDLTLQQQAFYDQLGGGYQAMYMQLNQEGRNRALKMRGVCPADAVEAVWAEGIYYDGCCK